MQDFNRMLPCQPINRVVPVPALRAEFVAQTLSIRRVVPDTGAIVFVPCRVGTVLVPNGHLYP
jgi:hypothetical protein